MLAGNLQDMSLPDVLRLLSASNQTGCLVLSSQNPLAQFYFKIGQISHCECIYKNSQGIHRVKGIDAVSKACNYTQVNFKFDPLLKSEDETLLKYPTLKLIDSISQLILKKQQQTIVLPAPEILVIYHPVNNLQNFKATPDDLSLLLLANGKRTLYDIAYQSGVALEAVQKWAAKFLQHKLLEEVQSKEFPTQVMSLNSAKDVEEVDSIAPVKKPLRYWRGQPIYE